MSRWAEIWNPKSFVMVEINLHQGFYSLKSAYVSKKNTSVIQFEEHESIEEIIKKHGKYKAYCLHVNGLGVLTRFVDFFPGYKEQLIINGDKDDFYFTTYNDETRIAVSFFRKSAIEEIVNFIQEQKLFLIDVTCGIIPMLALCLENENILSDFHIKIKNGKFVLFERNESSNENIQINQQFYSKEEAIFKGIYQSNTVLTENYESFTQQDLALSGKENYSQFNRFRFFGMLTVFTVLFALMVNYFYLNSLNDEVANLEVEMTLNNGNLSLLDQIKQEKQRKELLIQTSGVNQDHYISFFIDKIAETIPTSVDLQNLTIFPLKEPLKEKRKVEILSNEIEIIGTTPNSDILDIWMEKMNRFEWIRSVELMNYQKIAGTKAVFKLQITMQE